jgi:TonB family protein
MTETVRDRRRIIAAATAALVMHGVLFLLFPRVGSPVDHTFEAPLYVALDPVQPEEPEPAPDVPDAVPDPPAEESDVERDPEPEPEPEPYDTLAETAPAPAPDRPAPAPAPARETPAPTRAETAPAPSTASSEGAERTAPALEGTAEPAPPPRPAPERTFNPAGLERTSSDPADARAAEQRRIAEIAEVQEELAEWEQRQEESARALSTDSDAADSPDEVPTDRVTRLRSQLYSLIEGIRTAENVVSADGNRAADADDRTDPGSESGTDSDQPGAGTVTIDDTGGGTRRLLSDPAVDVSSVSLPGSFPPTYLAEVRFRVRPNGYVESASVVPPSPVGELDRVLEETVRSWRFEPASGSSDVEGSVRILIDTTD